MLTQQVIEASLPVRRPGMRAIATPTGRQELRAYSKQDRSYRTSSRQVQLDRQIAEAHLRAMVALGIVADEGLSVMEDQSMRSEARASAMELAACELAPTAIPQLAHLRQVASMQRAALLSAVGNNLIDQVRA